VHASATELRIFVYEWLFVHGKPPTSEEIAAAFGGSPEDARRALADLRVGKTVLTHPRTGEIWMAGPFSAIPTEYRVEGERTSWWANCAWDLLGVAVLANQRVRMTAQCADCGEKVTIETEPDIEPPLPSWIVHFLVPAAHWYDDIGFT
jgi:hypothetical protein